MIPFLTAHLKKSGLLILDAHITATDIFYSIIWARIRFPKAHMIVPIAGWLLYRQPNAFFIKILSSILCITFIPVYRSEELIEGEELQYTKHYPKTLTMDAKRAQNRAYLEKAKQAIKEPNTILFVAPYGDPLKYQIEVKRGVGILLEERPLTLLTVAHVNKWRFPRITYALFTFDSHESVLHQMNDMYSILEKE